MFKKKEYQYLKGMEVRMYCDKGSMWSANNKRVALGFVADIDYDIGITIKHLGTQRDLTCIRKDTAHLYGIPYRDLFAYIVICICTGVKHDRDDPQRKKPFGRFNGCAFE